MLQPVRSIKHPTKRQFLKMDPWTIVHGGQKLELAQKFMQVAIDMKCMETNFDGHAFFGFGDCAPFLFAFKTAKFSLRTIHGGQK